MLPSFIFSSWHKASFFPLFPWTSLIDFEQASHFPSLWYPLVQSYQYRHFNHGSLYLSFRLFISSRFFIHYICECGADILMFMPVTLLTPNTTIRTVPSFTNCHASTLKRAVRVETFSGVRVILSRVFLMPIEQVPIFLIWDSYRIPNIEFCHRVEYQIFQNIIGFFPSLYSKLWKYFDPFSHTELILSLFLQMLFDLMPSV